MKGGSNRLLTSGETAELLGVSTDYLYRSWKELGLKAYRIGKYLKFRERDIENWIERQAV